jgi:hypothetical protein
MIAISVASLQILDDILVLAALLGKAAGMKHVVGHVLALGLGVLLGFRCRVK